MARRPRVCAPLPALRRAVAEFAVRGETHRAGADHGRAARGPPRAGTKRRGGGRDRVVVSIFVNPAQFAPNEDFASYPRSFDGDLEASPTRAWTSSGRPPVETMYPHGFATRIVPEGPAKAGLEDKFRPHFFAGVATVVAKLLIQCAPDVAMFGREGLPAAQGRHAAGAGSRSAVEDHRRADGARARWARDVLAQRLPVGRRARGRADAAPDAGGLRRQDRGRRADRARARRGRRGDRARGLHARLSRSAARADAGAGRAGEGRDRSGCWSRRRIGKTRLIDNVAVCSADALQQAQLAQFPAQRLGHVLAPGAARSRSRGASLASR